MLFVPTKAAGDFAPLIGLDVLVARPEPGLVWYVHT